MRNPAARSSHTHDNSGPANAYIHPRAHRYPGADRHQNGIPDARGDGYANDNSDTDHFADTYDVRDANAHADRIRFSHTQCVTYS